MEDDPIVASYNVYMASPSSGQHGTEPRHYVFQYSSHRPSTKPYHSSRSQKPTALRIKQNTNLFEIEVPIITSDNYNADLAKRFGKTMKDAGPQSVPSYGLSGGFSTNHAPQHINLNDLPVHGEEEMLTTQVLGGKAAVPSDKDPVYMLAVMAGNDIHLTHLDGVVQMRPQLHHLDAAEEARRKADAATKVKQPLDGVPTKLETKAIEMKIKDSKEDSKDRSLNANAQLLRDIQADKWIKHEWIDEGDLGRTAITASHHNVNDHKLRAAISNDEWLDKMSSPSNELRQRLKGRDRERARRKRQERQRTSKVAQRTTTLGIETVDSESDSDSADENTEERHEASGDQGVDQQAGTDVPKSPEAKIKQEAETSLDIAPSSSSPTATRKRGRPKKT